MEERKKKERQRLKRKLGGLLAPSLRFPLHTTSSDYIDRIDRSSAILQKDAIVDKESINRKCKTTSGGL